MTVAERTMWFALRGRRLKGLKFRRQVTVGPYVVDFLCAEIRLIVELDGGQHTVEADTTRTEFLQGQGFQVVRYWNNDVLNNLEGVLSTLLDVSGAGPLTQPSPASGRGL